MKSFLLTVFLLITEVVAAQQISIQAKVLGKGSNIVMDYDLVIYDINRKVGENSLGTYKAHQQKNSTVIIRLTRHVEGVTIEIKALNYEVARINKTDLVWKQDATTSINLGNIQ